MYDIHATEIANAVHLSKSMVWKHLNGDSYNKSIDDYIFEKVLGYKTGGLNNDHS